MKLLATTDGNELRFEDNEAAKRYLSKAKGYTITVNLRCDGLRSSPQNRYYWGVVIANIRERMKQDGVHITPEKLHHYFTTAFIGNTVPTVHGEAMTLPGESSVLDVREFAEFVDAVVMWAWENLDLTIPEPNTQTQIELT